MKKSVVYAILICMSISVPQSFAVLYIDSMGLDVQECIYFDGTTQQFVLKNPITGDHSVDLDIGDIHVYGGGWDYNFSGSISVTPSTTTGTGVWEGDPYADFSTGATMTITASEVKDKNTDQVILSDVTLLEAQITADWWYLTETTPADKFISVDLTYEVTGGELYTGSTFKMLDFNAYWSFPDTSPQGSDFSGDHRSSNPKLDITAPVPEPATLMLLGLGGLLLRRKK